MIDLTGFEQLEPRSPRVGEELTAEQKRHSRKALYKAIILIFPDITIEDAPRLIDGVQAVMKAEFVAQGLMLGEFHLANNSQGVWSVLQCLTKFLH